MILSIVRILSLILISNNPSSLLLIYSVFREKQILIVAYKWTKYSNAFSSSFKASTVITVKYYSHLWLVHAVPSSQHLHVLPTLTTSKYFLKCCLLMSHGADISNTIHPKDLKTLWNALCTSQSDMSTAAINLLRNVGNHICGTFLSLEENYFFRHKKM